MKERAVLPPHLVSSDERRYSSPARTCLLSRHPATTEPSDTNRVRSHAVQALRWLFVCALLLSQATALGGVELRVGTGATVPGGTVSVPVRLVADTNAAAVQFDLVYTNANVTHGDAVGGPALADHAIATGTPANGICRVVIHSPVNAALGNGTVAWLPFTLASTTPHGTYPLSLSNVVLSAEDGSIIIPTSLVGGSLICTASLGGALSSFPRHDGQLDPVSEGWQKYGGGSAFAVPNDQDSGLDAWATYDESTEDACGYWVRPSASQIAQTEAEGWRMAVRMRIVSAPLDTDAIGFGFENGTYKWLIYVGAAENGDPVLIDTASRQTVLTGLGAGYHHYEMVYDASSGNADLFADGTKRSTVSRESTAVTQVFFGADKYLWQGKAHFNSVALSTSAHPVFLTHPASQSVAPGGHVMLMADVMGEEPMSYQWQRNSTNLPAATNDTLDLPAFTFWNTGTYRLVVSNSHGTATSDAAALDLLPLDPPSGIVAWWPGDGDARDVVGGNDGALNYGAGFSPGPVGHAFSLFAQPGFVTMDGTKLAQALSPATDFTIEACLEVDQDGAGTIVFQCGTFTLGVVAPSHLFVGGVVTSPLPLTPQKWQHIACVKAGNTYRLYLDGEEVAAGTSDSPVTFDGEIQVGCRDIGPWWTPSRVDELTVYSRALSQEEVRAIYATGESGKHKDAPLGIAKHPTALSAPPEATVTFEVEADGSPVTYQWQKAGVDVADGERVSGATTAYLTISDLEVDDAGAYAVVVSKGASSLTSESAELTVAYSGPAAVPSGLIAWWPGDGDAHDIVGGNDAELHEGATFAAGRVGSGFSLATQPAHLQMNGDLLNATFGTSTNLTIECWVKPESDGTYADFFRCAGMVFQMAAPDILAFSTGLPIQSLSGTLRPQKWHHIACVKDGNRLRLYEGGREVARGTVGDVLSLSGSVIVGRDDLGPWWTPTIVDELCVYNRALAQEELFAVFAAGPLGKSKDRAPSFVEQPASQTAAAGTTVEMSVQVAGTSPLTYLWRHNDVDLADGGRISGTTTSTLTIASVNSTDSGTYSVIVTNTAGRAESDAATLEVTRLSQTVTFLGALEKTYGDAPFELAATASSGLSVSYSSDNAAVATVSGSTVTIVGAGTCNLTATQSGDATYLPAEPVTRELIVAQAAQTITFDALSAKTEGDPPFDLVASASSGLPVSFSSGNLAVATVSGSTVTAVAAGTTVITASQSGDANHLAAPDIQRTLRVNPPPCLNFAVGTHSGMQGTQVVVPVTVSLFQQIASFQFSLHWDVTVMGLVAVEQFGLPGLASGSFGTVFTNTGTLTISWDDPDATSKTLADGSTLFALRFVLTGAEGATSAVTVDGTPTEIEALNEALDVVRSSTTDGSVRIARVYSLQTEVVGAGEIQLTPAGGSYVEGTAVTVKAIAGPGSRFTGWEGDLSGTSPSQTVTMDSAKTIRALFEVSIQITQSPESHTNLVGGNSVFTVAATSTDPLSYQWLSNGVALAGATRTALVLTNVQESDAGSYAVTITNVHTAVTSAPATLAVASTGSILTFDVANTAGLLGAEIAVPIHVRQFHQLTSVQFSLHWDTAIGTWVGVEQFGVAGLSEANFGTTDVANGVLTLSWDDADLSGETLEDGATLFALRLRLVGSRGTSGLAWINGYPTAVEAMNTTPEAVPVAISGGWVRVLSTVSVAGTITYYDSVKLLPDFGLNLTGDAVQTTYTAADGSYGFPEVDAEGDYTVTPFKTSDATPSRGVTTADITLLRRQILNVLPLDSPYKLLAADVNGSSSATTADITFIRRLILGINSTFPAGLWRFVPADYVFSNPQAPWTAPGSRNYVDLATDLTGQNFIAIKLGDLNNSWTVPAGSVGLMSRTGVRSGRPGLHGAGPEVGFETGSTLVNLGAATAVPITVSGFDLVTSVQFTLTWNPLVLQYVSTGDYAPAMSLGAGNFGTTMVSSGKLTFSWDDGGVGGLTLADASTLFRVNFTAIGGGGSNWPVAFADTPTEREVTVEYDTAEFASTDGQVTVNRPPVPTNPGLGAQKDEAVSFAVAKLALDADGDSLGFVMDTPSAEGAAVSLASGVVTYNPPASFVGTDSFTYHVSDGRGGSAAGVVTVTVSGGTTGSLNLTAAPTIVLGEFVARFAGVPNCTYTVEWAADPAGPWQKCVNLVAPPTDQGFGVGVFEFRESVGEATQRYYRTVYPAY